MLLDHIGRNAEPFCDFLLRKLFEPAHDEDLAAAGRKLFNDLMQAPQPPLGIDLLLRQGKRIGQILREIAEFEIFELGFAAAPVILDKIERGYSQKSAGLQNWFTCRAAQKTEKCFLQEIGRVLRTNSPRNELKQILPVLQE